MTEPHQLPVPLQLLKRFWVALAILLLVAGSVSWWFKNAFYDTGYAPEQPIAFYHKVHAGELKIDCKYCHFNAERGKHPGIPPMSVCLGCHRPGNVTTENTQYQKEIASLLAVAEKGSYEIDGKGPYHGEPDNVVYDGGVVHWKRVHKLPDHVYFSHQWHVRAGVACQTCHGPIQEMTVVRQFSDLTMGWCLDCHRQSKYVGGRRYDPADPSSFAVGGADRETQRQRQLPDDVVEFVARQVDTGKAAPAVESHAPESTDHSAESARQPLPAGEAGRATLVQDVVESHAQDAKDHGMALPPELRAAMQAKVANLPIWRLSDLPETHRKYYTDAAGFQNAPTQCNTCHQ